MNNGVSASKMRMFLVGGLLVLLVTVAIALLFGSRRNRVNAELGTRQASVAAGPRVPVAAARLSPAERSVSLSGEARPYATVTLYAKVSGYVREIRVDKGESVSRNQVLAVIDSPELDRQYDGAVADAHSKRLFAERNRSLLGTGAVAQQDYDTSEAAARTAEANAESLKVLKGYEVMRAPFSGTITARFVDPGAMVQSATTNQTASQPLVVLSQTERLRVYVYLDQMNAAFVKAGDRALIVDAARSDVRAEARVSRISGELDPKTRTLLTELDLDNRSGRFLAGGFVQVTLKLKTPSLIQVPPEALLQKGDKTFVGTVGADNRVAFRQVTVADSDGAAVRLREGLAAGERVVLNPGTGIVDGGVVQPVSTTTK